jgi:hypothetical protein
MTHRSNSVVDGLPAEWFRIAPLGFGRCRAGVHPFGGCMCIDPKYTITPGVTAVVPLGFDEVSARSRADIWAEEYDEAWHVVRRSNVRGETIYDCALSHSGDLVYTALPPTRC